ncbi:hypothetical protein [Noviherbaspirillum sedimenti]|uniref:hypothetical protein n=1 Tax=Noviherbaspirillum sedimenti TaxID=2320865 RepID=UPI0013146E5F|nr:hypothetical protein [Noviherbaspirillum sedimenti]
MGNLASAWITAKIAQHQIALVWNNTAKVINQETQRVQAANQAAMQRSQENAAMQRDQLRAQRSADIHGRSLAKQCADWERASAELKSDTAQAESRRHCANSARYIETGELPRNQ